MSIADNVPGVRAARPTAGEADAPSVNGVDAVGEQAGTAAASASPRAGFHMVIGILRVRAGSGKTAHDLAIHLTTGWRRFVAQNARDPVKY